MGFVDDVLERGRANGVAVSAEGETGKIASLATRCVMAGCHAVQTVCETYPRAVSSAAGGG